jgi:hypothetical protein
MERFDNLLPQFQQQEEEDGLSQDQELTSTRYEISLAEFPMFLLSKRPVDLDCIVYSDTIMADNKPMKREWKVSWSEKYGPATQSAAETFFALFQMWSEQKFESEWINFDNVLAILKRRGISTGKKDYQRVIRDLHCLCNIYIEANNAFWDSEKRRYIDATFHLFEMVILEKETAGNPDHTTRGKIKAHPVLLEAARKNVFWLGIQEKIFFALPGIQQRLYLYLRKMLSFQKVHIRSVSDLARQIPLNTLASKRIKQQIKTATQAILDAELIPRFASFHFYSSPTGTEMIRFDRSDSQQTSLFEESNRAAEIESNFDMIKEFCTDEHSFPFYRKVAELMNTDDIYRALSESKSFANQASRNGSSCSIPKVFTSRIKSIAQEHNISL